MALGGLGRLYVEIGADTSGLAKGITEAESKVGGLGGTLQKHGVAIGAAMTGVGVSALAISYKSVEAFKNIDSAMAGVRKTTGMTKDEIAVMKDEFISLSKEMPISAAGLADVGTVAGQLGITGKENIMEFTKTVAMMSTAFSMSAEDAATAMAKLATIYDIPIKEVGRLGSAVNVLGNTTAATEAQIMAYAMSLGAAARQLGFTSTQSLAMGASLISMGMDASDAGTRLNSAFTAMGNKIEEAAALWGGLGEITKKTFASDQPIRDLQTRLDAAKESYKAYKKSIEGIKITPEIKLKKEEYEKGIEDIQKSIKERKKLIESENIEITAELAKTEEAFRKAFGEDPMAVLQTIIAELDKIEDPLERNTAAADIFGTVGAKAINGLAGNLMGLTTNLESAQKGFDENKSLTEEYSAATDTLAAKLEISKNKTEAAAIAMGEAMAPATIMVADATAGFAGIITGLPGPLQETAGMAIMLAGGIGSIGGPLMMMIASAPGVMAALGGMTASVKALGIAFLTNPIFLVVTAIIAIVVLLYLAWTENWGGIQEKTAAVWDAITSFLSSLVSGITSTVTNVVTWLKSLGDKLLFLLGPIGAVIYAFRNWEQIKAIVTGIFNSLIGYISGLWSSFKNAGAQLIQGLIDGINSAMNRAVEAVKNGLQRIRNLLPFSDAKTGPLSDLTESGRKMMETFASGMTGAGDVIGSTFAASVPQPAAMVGAGATTNNNSSFAVNIQSVTLSKDYGFNEMLDDIRTRRMRDGMRFV